MRLTEQLKVALNMLHRLQSQSEVEDVNGPHLCVVFDPESALFYHYGPYVSAATALAAAATFEVELNDDGTEPPFQATVAPLYPARGEDRAERTVWRITAADLDRLRGRTLTDDELAAFTDSFGTVDEVWDAMTDLAEEENG